MASRFRLLSLALLVTLLAVGAAVARSPRDPKEVLRPADQRLARSITLRRSDFAAGWKQERGQSGGSEQLRCPKLGYDPNFSDLVLTGRATSPNFARGRDEFLVSSDVEVYRSAREARTSFRRSLAPGLNRCLENSLRQQATKNVKVGFIHVARLSFPRLGDRTAAFRVRALFQVGTVRLPASFDLVGIQRGRTIVSLTTFRIRGFFPLALERSLASNLARRGA